MTVIEYENDIIVVDCGMTFPQSDMLGIDYVIPDVSYLAKNKEKIRGFLFTHGHEDHIGATPFILKDFKNVPIYGGRLTLALIEHKMEEHRIKGIKSNVIKPGSKVKLGSFTITLSLIHISARPWRRPESILKTPLAPNTCQQSRIFIAIKTVRRMRTRPFGQLRYTVHPKA